MRLRVFGSVCLFVRVWGCHVAWDEIVLRQQQGGAVPSFPDLQSELKGVFEFALQQHAHEIRVVKEGPARYKTG